MINPDAIPQFTGNLEQLETDAADLKSDASAIAKDGADVHSSFQGLSAFYHAPEAEQLFATTKPVADSAKAFGDDLQRVSSALSDYAAEVRPIAKKLTALKELASAFVSENAGSADWQYDEHKVARDNELRHEVDVAVAAFWDAERRCANKIEAIFHGSPYVANDGSNRPKMYGYTADQLDHAKGLPWGDAVEQKHAASDVFYWAKSFVWDGLVIDGVWNTLKGLGGLIGLEGLDTFVNSWKGLAKLGIGLASYGFPSLPFLMAVPDSVLPKWVQESRKATRQVGKSLLAWDEWGKNPARAAGGVLFNGLTLLAGGEGAAVTAAGDAGKAGAAARIIAAAGKAGGIIDPMTYIGKGAGAAFKGLTSLPKVSTALDAVKNLKAGVFNFRGVVDPEAVRVQGIPEHDGSVGLWDGATFDQEGNLHWQGQVHQPPVELPADLRIQIPAERELVGAHAGGGTAHEPAPRGGGHELPDAVARTDHHVQNSISRGNSHGTGNTEAVHELPAHTGHGPASSGGDAVTTPAAHHGSSGAGGEGVGDTGPQPSGHIPDDTVHHVLKGEIKYGSDGRPRAVGYHFRPGGEDRPGVKVPKILERDHRTGLTSGNVWMRDPRTGEWIMKRRRSTFFPPHWTEQDVVRALNKAYENAKVTNPRTFMWRGQYKDITFEGYFDPITGDAKTGYPIMPDK